MTDKTGLLDLPVDILHLIFPYLDAPSFLNLTSTCKALHQPLFLQDSAFWSSLVRNTFRVPNQPVVQQDGQRWQRLFKRLRTQSRIYTWGNNEKSCLGHSHETQQALRSVGPPGLRRINALRRRHISWPEEMQRTQGLGVISDLQCGGWSTTLLTAKGALYIVGVIDGLQMNQRNPPYMQRVMTEPVPLHYPSGYPPPYERYDSATAVKQFSAGRAHVLALSDSGRIWSWQDIQFPAWHVRFPNIEINESGRTSGKGVVKKVVAGWNKSAALIEGTGIVVWDVLQRRDRNAHEDTALVLESVTVPRTNEATPDANPQAQASTERDQIGEIKNFIVLEHFIVFNTETGRVFAAQILWAGDQRDIGQPFELRLSESENEDERFATDVQGSFRNFAVFTRPGNVLTTNEQRLTDAMQWHLTDPSQLFTRVPALQNKDVIQLAFGDYHFHALHSQGHITSYGTEPQCCGALGLGGHGDGEGRLRSIRYQGVGGDGRLIPHAYTEGRRVWFEREKRAWITFLTSGGVDPAEAVERVRMAVGSPDQRCQGEISEWVEQEGRDWESKFGVRGEAGDEGDAYFALSVTAAGWHSGALVLVNDELATKLKRAVEQRDPAEPVASSSKTDGEATETDNEAGQSSSQTSTSYLSSAVNTTLDYGRWALGLPPYDQPYTVPDPWDATNAGHNNTTNAAEDRSIGMTAQMGDFQRGQHPINYGASPRVGVKYVWAEDHFPRLRLSDGTEMPGSVEFDEWRYERPVWDEAFQL